MPIYSLDQRIPQLAASCFIAPSAEIIGAVKLGEQCSVWFNTSLRGDNDWIEIGPRTNVQDNSVLHVDPNVPLRIAADVTIGHSVVLHGCRIGEGSLIGIGSIIMNHADIGANCLVGAHTLITEGKQFPPASLILGNPGKVIRPLSETEITQVRQAAQVYVDKIPRYRRLRVIS